MTSAREGELLTQVAPETPMGRFMRQYWIPAAKSSELVSDGAPIRLLLLGEKLIAFRDTAGRVGIMEHQCPHRCASLFFGRNEENGIRCVYHGWKFDVDGNCLEMPNVPDRHARPEAYKAKAYPTFERNGLIWTYMGDRASPPPPPALEPTLMPEDEMHISFIQRECNWMQSMEGDIDTSHFGFLHAGAVDADQIDAEHQGRWNFVDRAPDYHVADTDWGTMYAAHRDAAPGETYWRIAHFVFPFWTMPPDGDFKDHVIARAWVPMDDTHTMFVHLSWKKNTPGVRTDKHGDQIPGLTVPGPVELLPNTNDWHGRFRHRGNFGNDYLMDRDLQQTNGSYTGIEGIHLQDQAMTESMGPITDFTREHLVVSDLMVSRTRKRLATAARDFADGIVPASVDYPEICLGARSGDFIAPKGVGWLQAYQDQLAASTDPTGVLLKAAE